MGRRVYASVATVALIGLAVVSGSTLLGSTPVAQSASDVQEWEPPTTPWGHPDLQGNWSNATLTPFSRPAGWDPVLTWDEVREIEDGQADLVARAAEPSDPNRGAPEAGGTDPVCIDSGTSCYNEVYREPGTKVAIVNGEPRSSLVMTPDDGRVPALTDGGRERIAAFRARTADYGPYDHPETRPLAERCIVSFGSSAGPPMLPNYWYNNNYTFVQNEDHLMILAEMVHDVRIIRLGEGPPLPSDLRPYFGDSWGHWDGNTLVVETTNIHPDQTFRGVPPSEKLKVIERFTRTDETTLLYEFTIDDLSTYEEVWGGEIPFNRFDDPLYEYACHEGNYALPNVLSGARYQERNPSR